MFFGEIPVETAAGAILAHSVSVDGAKFKKGRHLNEDDVARLQEAGCETVIVARLLPDDVPEDEAADRIAAQLAGPGISLSKAFTGRVNFYAETPGVITVDTDTLHGLNRIDEAITFGTLRNHSAVAAKQMLATLKIIPFAAPSDSVDAWLQTADDADTFLLQLHPYTPLRAILIQTDLPGMKPTVLDKTVSITRDRLTALSGSLDREIRCGHTNDALRGTIKEALADTPDLLLIAGASAITDRRDVIPAAIGAAGGTVDHFGMPVDPGNLILTGRIMAGDTEIPAIGLPGCARSPKLNGFDWVLQRLFAGLPITPDVIMDMGHGGLLKEIATRPLPRADTDTGDAEDTDTGKAKKIAAIILAAGKSTRMGDQNKMLAMIDGKPMVRHVAEAVCASDASPVYGVTGNEADRVRTALASLPVKTVENPEFGLGLSTSVRAGIAVLPKSVDGALICLGDMPFLTADVLNKLIAAFDPEEGRAICIPTVDGKRGNPVLIARRFFPEIATLEGDQGARRLIASNDESVCEVAVDALPAATGILTDIDTPETLNALTGAEGVEASEDRPL
ncbi:MAG: molybdopterin-binding/glycosyltransferase family 2 protein [Alphaproteobacteria bacterium]